MRNTYALINFFSAKTSFAFALALSFGLSTQSVNAQTLYKSVSASQIDITAKNNSDKEMVSEGAFLIKDGQLDEIYKLKFVLPTTQFKASGIDSLLGDKMVTFEQTRVMVLPMMGMVHFVGTLDVGGVQSTTSFQLGYTLNADQSITFKGTRTFKLCDFVKELSKDELKLDIDFVLKNTLNNTVVLTAK